MSKVITRDDLIQALLSLVADYDDDVKHCTRIYYLREAEQVIEIIRPYLIQEGYMDE